MNTENRGWVGDPNERAPFRFHGAVVGLVDRCLSRTRNLAASNKHLAEFFSDRSWPKIGPGIFFFGVFERFETFFSKICSHSERYRNLLAGIFEILTFYGNIAFPLSPVQAGDFSFFSCLYTKLRFVPSSSKALIDVVAIYQVAPYLLLLRCRIKYCSFGTQDVETQTMSGMCSYQPSR